MPDLIRAGTFPPVRIPAADFSDHHTPPRPSIPSRASVLVPIVSVFIYLPQELVYRNAFFLFMAQLHSRVSSEWSRMRRFLPSHL